MIFLNILLIAARIFCGLCVVGFVLSLFLCKKHKIFKEIAIFICTFALIYGLTRLFAFAILGII